MKRLLTLEYYKNLTYRPFQVFSILYFAILVALLFIGLVDIKISENFTINLKEQGIYNFPEIWNFTTWIVALLKIFLGLIIVFSICQEFTNRMFKQNVIDGLSRKEFIASKLVTIFSFTFISTLIVFLITLIIGYRYSESTDSTLVFKEVFFIAHYFLKLFTFFSFLMFLSVLFRKSIFVLLAFFIWWIAEGIFSGIESFAKFHGMNPEQVATSAKNTFLFSKILPLQSMSQLIENPIMRLKGVKMFGILYEFQYPTESVIACIVWCVLFIFGSYWILRRRDW
jgi:ABC-type transport system involved in multi-copper enzyme maturation permease subunit